MVVEVAVFGVAVVAVKVLVVVAIFLAVAGLTASVLLQLKQPPGWIVHQLKWEASGGGGSGADRPAERSLDQGYRGSHPLYGAGSRTPWTGHNVSADQFRRYNQSGWSNDG